MTNAAHAPILGRPEAYEIPAVWDAAHVATRLIAAYTVVLSRPARGLWPAGYGAAWPDVVYEFSDLVEGSRNPPSRRRDWSALDLDRAEEALSWPLVCLAHLPHRAEAVTLWCYAKASRRSIRKLLRARAGKPYRIKSDTTLRRYLGPGLAHIAAHLDAAGIPVR